MNRLVDALFRKMGARNKSERRTVIIQFIKFGLVGVSNTLVSWAVYYFVLWIDDQLYLVGSIIGGILSIANAFFWNDRFVFSGGKSDIKSKLIRLGKTYISYGATSLFGILLLFIEVNFLHLDKTLAPPVNLIITIPLNYLINRLWTFK